jgi:CMP-N-acetylneuraminic acid synthetase
LDNPLNYSDYRDELEPLLKLISGLYKGIDATNPHVMNEIKENYPDFSMAALKKHLIELNKAAHDTLDKMSAKKETRGKKPKKALKTTVHALRKYFEKDCTLYSDDPAKLEQQQAIFIKTALQFANIPHPDNIKRLYYKEGETFTMLTQS